MGGKDFPTKYDHFTRALSSLPGGAEILFRLPDGSDQIVVLRRRPVGFDFHMNVPITVDQVTPGSYAEELGIQHGWAVARINGEKMDGKNYQAGYQHLAESIGMLPGLPRRAGG